MSFFSARRARLLLNPLPMPRESIPLAIASTALDESCEHDREKILDIDQGGVEYDSSVIKCWIGSKLTLMRHIGF